MAKSPGHRKQTWARRAEKWPKPVPRREKAPRICPAGRDLRAGQHRCIGNFRGFAGFSQMGCLVLQRKKFA